MRHAFAGGVCAALLLAAGPAAAQTPGTATLTFTTVTASGNYAPRHVLAAWVTDATNGFVRTLAVHGGAYRRHLADWRAASGGKTVDAVTGATFKRHVRHTVTWDCRSAAGTLVPDGEYRLRVEFTERNGRGPATPPGHLAFAKGPAPATLAAPDLPNFRSLSLVFAPAEAAR